MPAVPVLGLEALDGEGDQLDDALDLLAISRDVASRLGRDPDRRGGLLLVFLEQRILGHDQCDAHRIDILERADVLLEGLGDRPAFVDVALEVGDGPALHVEDGPGVNARGNEVFAEQDGAGPLGRFHVGHVDTPVLGGRVGDVLLVQPRRDGQHGLLVGERGSDERNPARRGREGHHEHQREHDRGGDADEREPLDPRPLSPKRLDLVHQSFQKIVHFSPPGETKAVTLISC